MVAVLPFYKVDFPTSLVMPVQKNKSISELANQPQFAHSLIT